MNQSLERLMEVKGLYEAGKLAEVVSTLEKEEDVVLESPSLALFYGTARARTGDFDEGLRWVDIALETSRTKGDRAVELRALNARGAIALSTGQIDAAHDFFISASETAEREGDFGTLGRCSNNLGIIYNLRGNHGAALGAYTAALAAFQQADNMVGVIETHHNMSITYRDQGNLQSSLEEANRAIEIATKLGAQSLHARSLAGRAETRLLLNDEAVAKREAETAFELHEKLNDVVGCAEDKRILAAVLSKTDSSQAAEEILREVIQEAEGFSHPLLLATAARDLALLLEADGRKQDALDLARTARTHFHDLGARAEVARLDELIDRLV
ncbi:MAG: tetratricopeptide repeat protein [Gemmatimonadota bacterium]|nr:tetratricopeptide repeat protein [Gemmatimonadota bacterium]MDH5804219.1 tetratricopeptide repeat protein [Gemmatimonadota bacterium]